MRIAVARNKFARGFGHPGADVPDAYEVVDLRDALERVYATDAHLVTYVVEGAEHQPRINKAGLPYFPRPVHTTTFMCDVDNPGHQEWTEAALAEAMAQYASLEVLATCGVYHTAHGRRVVQPLTEPIPAAEAEPYLRRWLLRLESAGLAVDWACRDWTRHFRLPHVRRGGRAYTSPLVSLERMRPIALEPLPDAVTRGAERPTRRAPRIPTPLAWSHDLPPSWEDRALALAKAIREGVTESWHEMYLALGGALLGRQCPPERLPAIVAWIAAAAGSVKPWSHRDSACDTARRYAAGLDVTGCSTLRRRWPVVADALDAVAATRGEARLREQARSAAAPPSLDESMAALKTAIRDAPDGLTVVSAECGMGKTHAAIGVAAERAGRAYASTRAKGERAPLQSKTAISVDKNALAEQIARDLRARGTPVRRVFGPLSVFREDGTHECRFHEVAEPLVAGGQAMPWALCKECEHREICRARDGVDGPDDARVTVGPHALLGELDAAAGTTGLLVIDEPPPALDTVVLTRRDFADARDRLDAFDDRYALALRPLVEAFDRWIDIADTDAPMAPLGALRQTDPDADLTAMVAGVENALPRERRSRAPPIRRADLYVARQSVGYARQLGNASRVLGAIHRAVTTADRVALRVEERGDAHAMVITMPREDFNAALRRRGAVVVTDANAELHLPVFEKIAGYSPRFHRFSAADGAPVERTLLRCRTATRRGWFTSGRVVLDAGVVSTVRAALEWAREDRACARLGLITMRLLRLLLEAAWKPDSEAPEELPRSAVTEARAKLGPVLRSWDGEILFGHYGAVRGLNTMADVDALVTLGDPWPNVGDARSDAAFLGLGVGWEARLEAMCRAELEQAHGRLRAVHRQRPARALHVGGALPSGHGWTSGAVRFRTMPRGPHEEAARIAPAEFEALVARAGGVRAASRALGCSRSALSRYCLGQREVPRPILLTLQAAAGHASPMV